MFRLDEVTNPMPNVGGAEIWKNGRTGEVANFATFKVHHTRNKDDQVVYAIEKQGVFIVQNPFSGAMMRLQYFLIPPPAHVLKPNLVPYTNVAQHQAKPQFKPSGSGCFYLSLLLGLAFWVTLIWLVYRLLVR